MLMLGCAFLPLVDVVPPASIIDAASSEGLEQVELPIALCDVCCFEDVLLCLPVLE